VINNNCSQDLAQCLRHKARVTHHSYKLILLNNTIIIQLQLEPKFILQPKITQKVSIEGYSELTLQQLRPVYTICEIVDQRVMKLKLKTCTHQHHSSTHIQIANKIYITEDQLHQTHFSVNSS